MTIANNPPSFIFKETGERLLERLTLLKITPGHILLQDSNNALNLPLLKMLYPQATIDQTPQERLYDLIIDNCSLLTTQDLQAQLFLTQQLLKPQGLLIFCTLGLATFMQYQEHLVPGLQLTDMHNLGDLILNLHFKDPVMEMEIVTLNYNQPTTLLKDLKDAQLLANDFMPISPIQTTIEIIYGHAEHSATSLTQFTDQHNNTYISVDSIEYLD